MPLIIPKSGILQTRVVSKEMMPEGVETTSVPPKQGDTIKVLNILPSSDNVQKRPNIVRKAVNFVKASAQHVVKGRPRASLKVIQERFAICTKCEYFLSRNKQAGECLHPRCGCELSSRDVKRNKLAWADQKCPIGKWTAVDG